MNNANEIYAIKRVSLDKTDPETMSGYMNEIALLKRLEGNSRIIRLIDSEVRRGPGGSRGYLMLVMECGEIGECFICSESAGCLMFSLRLGSTASGATKGTVKSGLGGILLAAGMHFMPTPRQPSPDQHFSIHS